MQKTSRTGTRLESHADPSEARFLCRELVVFVWESIPLSASLLASRGSSVRLRSQLFQLGENLVAAGWRVCACARGKEA